MIKPALYRVDQVMEILNCSRRTVYYLLEVGKLTGHNDSPGKNGLRVVASSVDEYVKRYELPQDYFVKKPALEGQFKRKILSKGVE